MTSTSKMRKSSLGRRSTLGGKSGLSSGESVSKQPEKKSMLLKPGFYIKRRASSEDRMSGISRNTLMSSAKSSRSQASLLDPLMTPCTPIGSLYYRNNMPSCGTRPTRSQTSSIDSNRLSSGVLRSTKKESRPINDKFFQADALKKVQDFFLKQPNVACILDNSMNIRPVTTKKFINMVDYLFQILGTRIELIKDNYVDEIIKTMKMLGYGGKLDKSWLITVNAQHTWQYVIGLLSWLVDLVGLCNIVKNDSSVYYPEEMKDMRDEEDEEYDSISDNMQLIIPLVSASFLLWPTQDHDPDFGAKQDALEQQLVNNILEKKNIQEDIITKLEAEVSEFELLWNTKNSEYMKDELVVQEKLEKIKTLLQEETALAEYIEKTKDYIENLNRETESFSRNIELAVPRREELKLERDCLKKELADLKKTMSKMSKSKEERFTLQQEISFNEKCIMELSKSIYSVDIKIVKLQKQMEEPLVAYNQMIAVNLKYEPQLKSCVFDSVVQKQGRSEKNLAAIGKLLNSIKSNRQDKCNELSDQLAQVTTNRNCLEEQVNKLEEESEKLKLRMENMNHEIDQFGVRKAKDTKRYQDELSSLEEDTKQMTKTSPLDLSTNEKLILIEKEQREDLAEVMKRATYSFGVSREMYSEYARELKRIFESGLQDVQELINKKRSKGK